MAPRRYGASASLMHWTRYDEIALKLQKNWSRVAWPMKGMDGQLLRIWIWIRKQYCTSTSYTGCLCGLFLSYRAYCSGMRQRDMKQQRREIQISKRRRELEEIGARTSKRGKARGWLDHVPSYFALPPSLSCLVPPVNYNQSKTIKKTENKETGNRWIQMNEWMNHKYSVI